jgi:hypothetical protein
VASFLPWAAAYTVAALFTAGFIFRRGGSTTAIVGGAALWWVYWPVVQGPKVMLAQLSELFRPGSITQDAITGAIDIWIFGMLIALPVQLYRKVQFESFFGFLSDVAAALWWTLFWPADVLISVTLGPR